jgi:hypothetical protein
MVISFSVLRPLFSQTLLFMLRVLSLLFPGVEAFLYQAQGLLNRSDIASDFHCYCLTLKPRTSRSAKQVPDQTRPTRIETLSPSVLQTADSSGLCFCPLSTVCPQRAVTEKPRFILQPVHLFLSLECGESQVIAALRIENSILALMGFVLKTTTRYIGKLDTFKIGTSEDAPDATDNQNWCDWPTLQTEVPIVT